MNGQKHVKPMIILTGNRLYDQVMLCYTKPASVILAENPKALSLILKDNLGALLFLELALFNDDVTCPMFRNILKKAHEQRIVVVADEQDPAKLYPLMKQGVRGFCHPLISDGLLLRAIEAVNKGELWIERRFVCFLVGKLVQDHSTKYRDAGNLNFAVAALTAREKEIAGHVAQGKCDKLIARDLNISPNTVKNHLSKIFKKLEIDDRINLALIYKGIANH